ncbi:MAG TPA: hypothetical protein EYP19_06475 [Desulfobacterales bacterium]|nr:hypothetical protein [Desulfobacterales bacterium]
MKLRRPVMTLWVMGALLTAFSTEASNARSRYEILYTQKQLGANVVDAFLGEVLLAVAKEAEVTFSFDEAVAARKVSVRFDKLSLEEGIKKIIHPFSYSMVFAASGQLEKVTILKSGLRSAEEPISEAERSKRTQAVSQPDLDPSLGPGGRQGGQDEGLPPSAPVPEVPGKEMEGDHGDQYPAGKEESGMEAPKHPAGDMAAPPEAKEQNPAAEGP